MIQRRPSENQAGSRQGFSSPDEEIRRSAVAALAGEPLSETRSLLLEAMGDRSWRVRKEAVEVFLATPSSGGDAEELFGLLRSPDNAGLRNSAVEALVRLGMKAIPVVGSHAGDADCDVRKFVVDILGGIGDVSSLPLLIKSLDDEDPNVRAAAAENLGRIGHASSLQPLLDALSRPDLALRHTVLDALARTGGPVPAAAVACYLGEGLLKKAVYRCLGAAGGTDAAPYLVNGLEETAGSVREAALQAVAEFRERNPGPGAREEMDRLLAGRAGSSVVDGLLAFGTSTDPSVRRSLIRILGAVGDPRAAGYVLRACGNDGLFPDCLAALRNMEADSGTILEAEFSAADATEKANILRICGEMGARCAVSLIVKGMASASPQVREAAVRTAGRSGDTALVPEVAALLKDLDQDVRTSSLDSLARLSRVAPSEVAGIVAGLSSSPEPETRRNAAYLCGVLRDGERLALLMKDEDALVRRTAVQGMSQLEGEDAVHHLILSLTDEIPEVRIAAASALGETGGDDALQPLRLAARDEDSWVRCAALRSLGRIGGRQALDAIEESLDEADGLVSLAALDALARIEGERALELIRRATSSRDDEVVKTAISILAERGDGWLDQRAEELLRHPHWDVRNAVVRFLADRQGDRAIPLLRHALETESDDLVRGRIVEILERVR